MLGNALSFASSYQSIGSQRCCLCVVIDICLVMVKATRRCFACKKLEYSVSWHGRDDVQWCHAAHLRYIRNRKGREPLHPSWSCVREHVHDLDKTGNLIFAAGCRADVQAMLSCGAVLSASKSWHSTAQVCFVAGFALHMYWPWTMMQVVLKLLGHKPIIVTGTFMRNISKEIKSMFQGVKVHNGILVNGNASGLDPFKNPMERQSGFVKFNSLADETKQWQSCCVALAAVLDASDEISIADLLAVIRNSSLSTFSGKADYGNIRLCRAMVFMNRKKFHDSSDEWSLLCNQSPHLKAVVKKLGLSSFSVAVEFRDAFRILLNQNGYCLNDLATFLCLAFAGHS